MRPKMNIFEKIKAKLGIKEEEKSQTEIIEEKRQDLKFNLVKKLYEKGCSEEDIDRILMIIESAESDINRIKASLIGTNINPQGDPNKPLFDGVAKIRARQQEMQYELDEALKEIFNKENK